MKMKKLLASALAAAMVLSTMVGTVVTSAATTVGTITAGTVNAVAGKTDTITADINIKFTEGVVAPHNIISVALEGYKLTDVTLGEVTYTSATEGVVSIDADGSNLAAGKVLLECPVDSKAPTVTAIALTATFVDADDVDTVAGTYAIVVNGDDMTDFNEREIGITAVNGSLVVAAPHVCDMQTKYDENGHWTECACGEKTDAVAHELGDYVANEDGTTETASCACGYTTTRDIEVVEPECDHANADLKLSDVTATEFVYVGTCPECAEEVVDRVNIGTPLASPISISKTLQPRNDVSILLEVPTTNLASYTDYVVVANKQEYASGVAEPTVVPYYITEYADSTVYAGYTEFVFGKINAYEMNNDVHFVLYGKDTNGDMIELGTLDYSVITYVTNQLTKKLSSTRTAELKTMLVDMIIYSSKTQEYGEFNVANLAVDSIKDLVEEGTNKPVMDYATPEANWPTAAGDVNALADTKTYNLDTTTPAGTLKMSKTLELSNRVNTLFVITNKNNADINDLYIKYEYYDVQGNPATPYVAQYEGAIYQNTYPAFVFDAAPVSVYDYPVKATVYYGNPDDDGVAVAYAYYNPATYISKNCSDSSSVPAGLRTALRALNAYANSLAVLAGVSAYNPS